MPSAAVLALLALLPSAQQPAQAASTPAPWERIVVIGASAAAGYGTARESRSADVPFGRFVEAMLARDHEEVTDLGHPLFFLDPRGHGRRQARRAAGMEPTLVIAVDFLFWFTYGVMPGDKEPLAARRALLEEGLTLLAGFDCPVLAAEVPDMRQAIGTMLLADQVPSPKDLEALNARIRAWAAERPNVVLVPLAAELERLRGRDRRRGAGEAHLIQWDHLHPTMRGLSRLSALCLKSLLSARPDLPAQAFRLDEEAALDRVRAALGLGDGEDGSYDEGS